MRIRILFTAIGLFSLATIYVLVSSHVFADTFYPSGDITACVVSLAPYIRIASLPVNNGGISGDISYDGSLVKGIQNTISSFETIATDSYPSAREYPGMGMSVAVPPGSLIDIRGIFKNANPYTVDMSKGVLYTSLSDGNDIERLASQKVSTSHTSSLIYAGKNISRSGEAIDVAIPPFLRGGEEHDTSLYLFTAITPITATRSVAYSFSSSGELLAHFVLHVVNNSDYQENNIHVVDEMSGIYAIDEDISLSPHVSQDIAYDANFGTLYPSSFTVPPASITDPNTHTEILQEGEAVYEERAAATSVFFSRDDSGAPAGWAATQSSLPFLVPNATMSITLIPYTYHTASDSASFQPVISIEKKQNGTTDDLSSVRIGEAIHYDIRITNTGNAPAAGVFVSDNLMSRINILDPMGGTVCKGTETRVDGFICDNAIVWPIGMLKAGESKTVSFKAVVANYAITGENIFNIASVTYNTIHTLLSNQVNATLVLEEPIPSSFVPVVLAASVSTSSGSILGVVWDDTNRDSIFEPTTEMSISHVPVSIAFGSTERETYTNDDGIYEFDGLPFGTPIRVHISYPSGYVFASTYQDYDVVLEDSAIQTSQTPVGTIVRVNAGRYFNAANLGVYKGRLPDTGQHIFPILVMLSFLSLISIFLYLHLNHFTLFGFGK